MNRAAGSYGDVGTGPQIWQIIQPYFNKEADHVSLSPNQIFDIPAALVREKKKQAQTRVFAPCKVNNQQADQQHSSVGVVGSDGVAVRGVAVGDLGAVGEDDGDDDGNMGRGACDYACIIGLIMAVTFGGLSRCENGSVLPDLMWLVGCAVM